MPTATTAAREIALTRQPRFPFERALLALALFTLIATPVLLFGLVLPSDPERQQIALSKLVSDPRLYLLLATLPLCLYVPWRLRHHESLRLNDRSIYYTPPFSWWPKAAFAIAWQDLDRAELAPACGAFATPMFELRLHSKGRCHRLHPLQWFALQITWQQHMARRGFRRRDPASAFATSELGRQLVARGIAVSTPQRVHSGFDLFANSASKAVVITLLLLLCYALIDAVLVQQRFLDFSPVPLLALLTILGGAGAIAILFRAQVPLAESAGVGLLFGLAFSAASYPGLLRLNQCTDWNGGETTPYVRQADGRFVAAPLPVIEVEALEPFWDQVATGQRYPFTLYCGSLGVCQLDEAPVNDDMREFYRQRDNR